MAELSFEKALAELEDIVAKLEDGGLSLNESLALFEKGVKRAKFLREELEKAEKKTEILLKDEKGDVKPESFVLGEEPEEDAGEPDTSSGNGEAGGGSDEGENSDLPF